MQLTCDVGTADVDGREVIDGDSDGALVGQIETLRSCQILCQLEKNGKKSLRPTLDSLMAHWMVDGSVELMVGCLGILKVYLKASRLGSEKAKNLAGVLAW